MLDELRDQGLVFIYSSQVVPSTLTVREEPHASGGEELAREILAPHGLTLSRAAPNIYAVIQARDAPGQQVQSQPAVRSADSKPELEEVVVQTSRYEVSAVGGSSGTHLTQAQVASMPRLADETLRALQRLPGVASDGFSSFGPVRGGVPNETAIILDGLRLYEPFHLKNFLNPVSLLDSRTIEGLSFYSGGFPAIYGDRMSSIIDATSVRPESPAYYEIGLNFFHTSALISHDFSEGRGHFLLSARRSNVGDLVRYSENDFGDPHYADGMAKVEYQLDERTKAAFNLLISGDSIEANQSARQQTARASYRNTYVWGTVDRNWSDRFATRAIVSFTDLDNIRRAAVDEPGQRVGRVSDDREFDIIGLRIENTFDGDVLHQRFGAEVRHLAGDYVYANELRVEPGFPFPGSPGSFVTRSASPSPEGYESSAYWDARVNLADRFTLQGGLRIDTQTYDGSSDGEQLSPRVSVLYTLGPQTHLRASWGRFYQSQGINELQVEDGVDRFYPAQHADHTILSFDHSFSQGVDLRIEAYLKDYREINPRFENVFDPLVLFPEAQFDRVRIAPQSATAQGVELLLRLQPHGSWSGWFNYAWSRVTDRVDGQDVPRSWDQRHALNLGVAWTRGPWSVVLADTFHSGWPTTSLQLDTSSGTPRLRLDGRNRSNFDYYNTLDFRMTRTFLLSHGVLDVFAEVSNATSRENQCCVRYDVTSNPDGTLSIGREVDTWLPLVPSLGALWRY